MRTNKRIKKTKVAVALSGGVDSGVAAALLVKKGYQCVGFHMKLWRESSQHLRGEAKDVSGEHLGGGEAARTTAHRLGIPFYVVDLEKIFKKRVVDYFLQAYAAGLTPNPCVMCNRFIKFGELLSHVRELGYDYLATGHYSRVATEIKNEKLKMKNDNLKFKIYHLLQGIDGTKDQSYFLYNLTQVQLAHLMFPVGDYTKEEVKKMAKEWNLPAGRQGLPVAKRPESQEICFFPENDYRPFLKRQMPGKIVSGEVVDTKGRVIGKHQGLPLYTIGQRHGFEVKGGGGKWEASREVGVGSGAIPPFYVIAKDVKKNQLIVGFGKETEKKEFWVKDVNWINPNFQFSIFPTSSRLGRGRVNFQLFVRIRHQGELLRCKIENVKGKNKTPPRLALRQAQGELPSSDGEGIKKVKVVLAEPQRGIAPGQAAVFYVPFETLVKEGKKLKIQTKNLKRTKPKNRLITNHYSLITDFEVLGGGIIALTSHGRG